MPQQRNDRGLPWLLQRGRRTSRSATRTKASGSRGSGQVKIDDRAAPTLLRSRAPCRLGGKGPGGRL